MNKDMEKKKKEEKKDESFLRWKEMSENFACDTYYLYSKHVKSLNCIKSSGR